VIDDRPVFARHESFYPRVGWLWKAVTLSEAMPDIFLRESATVELGVGKNMVRAIRYWGVAMRVIEEYLDPAQPRRSLARPTGIGKLLFGPNGWDPYLEDPRTIWLLHWLLTRPPSLATAWQLLFGLWSRTDFTEQDAVSWLRERSSREPAWPEIAEQSLRRDVQCILQMYGPPRRQSRSDDLVESPFREIGLLVLSTGDNNRWRFLYGPKPGLTAEIVAFACLDYAARESSGSSLTVSRLALEPYSPGMMMRQSETQISKALESVAEYNPALRVISPVGVRQLVFDREPARLAVDVLAGSYRQKPPASHLDALLGSHSIVRGEAA
jgi:Protein of unknown function (DUF4007)